MQNTSVIIGRQLKKWCNDVKALLHVFGNIGGSARSLSAHSTVTLLTRQAVSKLPAHTGAVRLRAGSTSHSNTARSSCKVDTDLKCTQEQCYGKLQKSDRLITYHNSLTCCRPSAGLNNVMPEALSPSATPAGNYLCDAAITTDTSLLL